MNVRTEVNTTHLALDLNPKYLVQLQKILREFVPDCEVWAYGSRARGTNHDASDLDLVVYRVDEPSRYLENLDELQQALTDSNLPILVQVLDWARIPEAFRTEIKRGYVKLKV